MLLEQDVRQGTNTDSKTILTLLNCFETEAEVKQYVKTHMILCRVHGICSKRRAKECPNYDSWTDIPPYEQECEWCVNQEELR